MMQDKLEEGSISLLKLHGVVILAAVDWNFLRQRVHHLATGMAWKGMKVLLVENTAVRSPGLADLPRILKRLEAAFLNPAELLPENLAVYSPLAAPWPYNKTATAWNFSLLKQRVQRFLEDEKATA